MPWSGGSFAESCSTHRERWCAPCYSPGSGYRSATVRVDTARVLVGYRVVVKDPKSANGRRTLPLDVEALRALWVRQAAERLAAGPDYSDEGGRPSASCTARPSEPPCER